MYRLMQRRCFHRAASTFKDNKVNNVFDLGEVFPAEETLSFRSDHVEPAQKYLPYRQWIDQRRDEAKRSIFVQVKSQESAQDLLNYCGEEFGAVDSMHFHFNPTNIDFPVRSLCRAPDLVLTRFVSRTSSS